MAMTNASAADGIVNKKRTEENFDSWKECLKNYLIGQGLWEVVSEDKPKPEEIDPNYKDWIKKNALALHAIQISCEEDTISNLMSKFPNKVDSAKFVWKHLAEMDWGVTEDATSSSLQDSSLCMAVEKGDLNTVKELLKRNPNYVSAKITVIGQTALHLAVLGGSQKIVEELVKLMSKEDMEIKTNFGNTAFSLAALNDKALDLLKKYPQLGYAEDLHQNYAIKLLANQPSAFLSGSKLGFGSNGSIHVSVPNVHPGEMLSSQEPNDEENGQGSHKLEPNHGKIKRNQVPKSIKVLKLRHAQVLQLLKVFKEIATLSEEQLKNIGLDQVIYDAIKRGSFEFINELITCNPVIIWRGDKKGRTLFAHAITLRQEKIFNLIYRFGSRRRILIMLDVFNNNYLHLAAKLSPSFQLDQVPGAALQMQRELQWFKGIEGMLPPKFGERLNENFLTPSALFTKEHKELVKEGERWMKNNTASCMVVAALIATVMFTTAFTAPGGNDQTGFPFS
ncbi:hypothetical protein GH714_001569 [Hevea brasiliensis]|uniref:Uncharacterized protein n=1 Tax=Hevea brasiliensis TaxID=3981 RepID=A0A6A6M6L3_HEVBR|nr:hypothetical protein GH714_001569 [Hevea brasiliensis]